jgi:phosphoribosylamine--glycine ligase
VAGERVLIEQFLTGEEASVMGGVRWRALPAAAGGARLQARLDGDRGPNTGGMGAVAPAPMVSEPCSRSRSAPRGGTVLQAMAARGTPFRGVLYCGLMIVAGEPRVLEFNVRFGDPSGRRVLPLLDGSLARLLASAAQGALDRTRCRAPRAPRWW